MARQFALATARRIVLAVVVLMSCGTLSARQFADSLLSHLGPTTFLLDRTLTEAEAEASPYLFRDVRTALAALRDGTEAQPMRLLIAPGVYWVDDPDDPAVRRPEAGSSTPYGMTVRCRHLSLEGLTGCPEDVVLASSRGQTQGADGNFTMLRIVGDDLRARGLTFGNYCNVDLIYPRDRSQERPRRSEAIVQAQLVHVEADRVYCDSCRFVSRLNLCPMTGARRTLFRGCHFESTDDALAGSAVYVSCHFTFFSSKPWYSTPAWGAVLLDCDIDTHTRGRQYFTKVGGGIAVIDTRIRTLYDAAASPLALGWSPYDDTATGYQAGVTLNGQPVLIGEDNNEGRNATAAAQRSDLTGRRLLEAYKVTTPDGRVLYNTPNLLGGDDGWDPLGLRPAIEAAERQLGRPLLGLPTYLAITPRRAAFRAQDDTVTFRATLHRWGNYDLLEAKRDTVLTDLMEGSGLWTAPQTLRHATSEVPLREPWRKFGFSSRNTFAHEAKGLVAVEFTSGLKALASVSVAPHLQPAPTFASRPALNYDDRQSEYSVDYQLSLGGGDDVSQITWYRYKRDDMADTIAVRRGTPAQGQRTYRLAAGDVGYRIAVRVTPRRSDTHVGTGDIASAPFAVDLRKMSLFRTTDRSLAEDFATLPVGYQPQMLPGFWTFDGYKPADTAPHDWQPQPEHAWYYGEATDGARGRGLVQATRGARCFYIPVRKRTGDMTVTLRCDPCKTAGQGFGSATGQYLDVYIKFDPETLTGYALRIERSPNYDKAVLFTLVEYRNGTVTPLTEPQPSSCFRTTCTITLSVRGTTLSAEASTDNPAPGSSASAGVLPDVRLSARIAKSPHGAIGLQHTGSTGASATLIHLLAAEWK